MTQSFSRMLGQEAREQERIVAFALRVTLGVALVLGLVNVFVVRSPEPAVALFLLAAVCLPLIAVNRGGRTRLAAWLLAAAILAVLTYSLSVGDGIHDAGALAYPVFVVIGALILGRGSLLPLTTAAILSMGFVSVVDASRKGPYPGDADDFVTALVLMLAMASITWLVLQRAEAHLERVRRSEREVLAAYDRTLEGWAKALEYRCQETEGHSRRVAEVSEILARSLGCSEQEILHVRRGALLHDIGKLAVPDAILRKPGPLSPEERAEMERHPDYAHRMLSGIEFLRESIDIPWSHHERFDGGGYPRGLKGEEIPLSARLFTVVDQWEALSSDRPYRTAWSPERVRAHLRENAGTIYDPRIVEVFVREVLPGLG